MESQSVEPERSLMYQRVQGNNREVSITERAHTLDERKMRNWLHTEVAVDSSEKDLSVM